MRKAAMTTRAWRVDRRTTRAIAAMSKALFLTIETGVEAMVRDGCQPGGRGRPSLGLAIPAIWFKSTSLVGHFELLLWPGPSLSALWLHSPNHSPDSCGKTIAQAHPREITNAE